MSARKVIATWEYYSENSNVATKHRPAPAPNAKGKYKQLPAPHVGDRIVGAYNDGTTFVLETRVRDNKPYWRVVRNASSGNSRKHTGYALSRSLVSQAIQHHNNGLGISTKSPVKLAAITSEAGKKWIASLSKGSRPTNSLTLTEIWNEFNVAMKQPGAYGKYVQPVLALYTNEIMFGKQSGSKSGSALEAFLAPKVKKTGQIVSPVRQPSGNLQTELEYYRNYGMNVVPASATGTKTYSQAVTNSQVGGTKKSKTKVNNTTTSSSSQ